MGKLGVMESGIIFVIVAVVLVLVIVYLLTLQNVLKQVGSKNREVEPGNVWLMLIPFFNIVYGFILYPKICDSIKNEYQSRGLRENGDFGRGMGIAMPILNLCGIIPIIGGLAGLANLIIWIVFWSKMSGYKTTLINSPSSNDGMSNREDLLD